MQEKYAHKEVERAVHARWEAADAYRVVQNPAKKKFYACSMLPYPSGKLHMGHVRNYTINDMLTRHMRMRGYNVLMPMGWDAFGLPAENAALKNGVPPAKWTHDNIAYMKQQMQAMGLAIDWSREVATCDPNYYKWNQWLFLKMLEKGIAYRKTQIVNWDPVDKTVLANEQVNEGRGWRTGALVEKREIPGYYLGITRYAQELLDHAQIGSDKATLQGWPDKVRLMQENWIGKSEGVRFAFTHDIHDASGRLINEGRLYVFTTRADTLMGVSFCAVAPEHPLALHASASDSQLAEFLEDCKKTVGNTEAERAKQEKKGRPTGLFVRHPITGAPVAVWVANYVLMSYGDGAVMGVPAHDERDFAFAKKYQIKIIPVIAPKYIANMGSVQLAYAAHAEDAIIDCTTPQLIDATSIFVDWSQWRPEFAERGRQLPVDAALVEGLDVNLQARVGDLTKKMQGLSSLDVTHLIADFLKEKGLGEKKTIWRLRDWGISRQRYWGTPIPIIHCPEHGAVPVPEKDLPVVLPQDCVPDGTGNPLEKHEGFHAGVVCPICGQAARRETDTMDTFVDSSWYFMRYCEPDNANEMITQAFNYWMPMDQYIGGIEHAILHLLYARFWTKVMRDLGMVNIDEPFTKLLSQGMVLNHVYSRAAANGGKDYFWPHDVEQVFDDAGKVIGGKLKNEVQGSQGTLPVGTPIDYEGVGTMSKSKNNGVDPQDLIEKYGADTARLYTMFTAPPHATLEWNDAAVEGSYRFLRRVWGLAWKHAAALHAMHAQPSAPSGRGLRRASADLRFEVHAVLKQMSYDYERMHYNTVVSGCMKLLNALEDFAFDLDNEGDRGVLSEAVSVLLRTLYPVCPHMTAHLWVELGYAAREGDLLDAPWPQVDEAALQRDEVALMLQVNGKLRGSITVAASASQAQIEQAALASDAFVRVAQGAVPKKIVWVPGRLVNVVL